MSFVSTLWRKTTKQASFNALTIREMKLTLDSKPNYVLIAKCCNEENNGTFAKWDRLKHQLFNSLFENRAGCLFTTSKDTFEINKLDSGTVIEKTGGPGSRKTYVMPKECWTSEDLEKVATSMQLDLGDVWMRPRVDINAASAMTPADIDDFWKFIHHQIDTPNPDYKKLSGDIEVVGGIGDGSYIFWSNPSPERVSSVLEFVKQLALDLEVSIEQV